MRENFPQRANDSQASVLYKVKRISTQSPGTSGTLLAGDAIVGTGHRAKIRAPVALAQLRRNLDIDRLLGMKGKAKLDARPVVVPIDTARPPQQKSPIPEPDDATLEGRIKLQRLDQLSLANAAAREEAAARSGRYVRSEDAKQEMGRVASRLMTLFESSLTDPCRFVTLSASAQVGKTSLANNLNWAERNIVFEDGPFQGP